MTDALATIVRLRRVAEQAGTGGALGDDGPWLADALRAYLDRASKGATIDGAFGLTVPDGGEPWWRIELRTNRNAALREYFTRFCTAPTDPECLGILQNEIKRYARSQWSCDRKVTEFSTNFEGSPRGLLFRSFRINESLGATSMPLSVKQLRRILASHSTHDENLGHAEPRSRGVV
jgi:hypothetical protein